MINATVEIERALGYAGFIHDFKNAVLRPKDRTYITRALEDLESIDKALMRLDTLGQSRGIQIETRFLTDTLDRYRENLLYLRDERHDYTDIHWVDSIVRVPDGAARRQLTRATADVKQAFADDYWPLRNTLWASTAAFAVFSLMYWQQMRRFAQSRLEAARLDTQTQLLAAERAHNVNLTAANGMLAQINREQAEMAYAISHDLKSPTNTARMLLVALKEDLSEGLDEDSRELMADLDSTLDRMGQIIEDMLEYTTSLDQQKSKEPISLDDVLTTVIDDMRADISAQDVTIERAPLGSVSGDPRLLNHLMRNLLSNAIKFRDPRRKPVVRISPADAPQGYIAFNISDNGIGIAPEHHDKIFGLFRRLHRHDEIDGTGLGLPICLRVAKAHGGDIHLSSTPGEGSTFTVKLRMDST
ncbi:sensor histidine kinase [Sagittula sp. SSi028]|uniref:sensor histidine kinase n=1 Tax=Sagittula sp. SSi028 TaxID=3400636 RepID=UPI003AF512E3